MLLRAFIRDFVANGPSVARIVYTTFRGYKRHKNHPDSRVRDRIAWEARGLAVMSSALIGAVRLYYRGNTIMYVRMSELLAALHREFKWKSRLSSFFGGRWLLRKIRQQERRLANGQKYEPDTFYTGNGPAVAINPKLQPCRFVTPSEGHCVFNS
jgi:hypothetical protein